MALERTKRNWERFGKMDPLRAILTDPARAETGWEIDEFFASGRDDVAAYLTDLSSSGVEVERKRALDFGCGVGRLTQALSDHFERCDGVDIAGSMIRHARRLNRAGSRCQYHVNDSPDLALFPDGSFDLVLSIIVLQHIPPPAAKRYVGEFLRVLRPGGAAFFQVPARSLIPAPEAGSFGPDATAAGPTGLRRIVRRLKDVRPSPPVMDMYCIPIDELEAVITQAGGQLVDVSPYEVCGPDYESFRYVAVRPTEVRKTASPSRKNRRSAGRNYSSVVPEAGDRPGADDLVGRVRREVEKRYRSGEYPPELQSELHRHFDDASREALLRPAALAGLQAGVDRAAGFGRRPVRYDSSVPFGGLVHRLIGKLTRRQTDWVLEQMRGYAEALRPLLVALSERADTATTEKRARLEAIDDFASRRLRLLGESPPDARARVEAIAESLARSAPVVDLESGRGDMLATLKRLKIEAIGVDPDPDVVATLTSKGLAAVTGASVGYLEALDEASVGGIVARHDPGAGRSRRLLELVDVAHSKLRPGGRLIIHVAVAAGPDLEGMGRTSVPADLLLAIIERAGYSSAEVLRWPAAAPDAARRIPGSARVAPGLRDELNRIWERLDSLPGPGSEFAVIATR